MARTGQPRPVPPRDRSTRSCAADGTPINDIRLQAWIDELYETSGQQWLLRLVAVLAPFGAMTSVALEAGRWRPVGLVIVVSLSIGSAFRPDSHTPLAVIGIAAWYWLAVVD